MNNGPIRRIPSFAKLSIIIKYNTKVDEMVYDINAWISEVKL